MTTNITNSIVGDQIKDSINGSKNQISIVKGDGNQSNATEGNNNQVGNNDVIIKQVRKNSFWVSLITGIVASLIASFIYNCFWG